MFSPRISNKKRDTDAKIAKETKLLPLKIFGRLFLGKKLVTRNIQIHRLGSKRAAQRLRRLDNSVHILGFHTLHFLTFLSD